MARRGLEVGEWGEMAVIAVSGPSPFMARVRFRGFDGRVRFVERRAKTARAAKKALREELEEQLRRGPGTQLSPSSTFEDVAKLWLTRVEQLAGMGQRSPATV